MNSLIASLKKHCFTTEKQVKFFYISMIFSCSVFSMQTSFSSEHPFTLKDPRINNVTQDSSIKNNLPAPPFSDHTLTKTKYI